MQTGMRDMAPRSQALRRERFVTTLRGLLVLVLVSVPLPLLGLTNPEGDTARILGMVGLFGGLALGYAGALLAARLGRWTVAETTANTLWTSFPAALVLFFDGDSGTTVQTIILTIATLSIGVVQSVMLALGSWERARSWVVASFSMFAVAMVVTLLSEGLSWVSVVSLVAVSVLLSAANLWPVRTMFQDLEAALEASEAANVAKTRFLSNMSHELRTPLNAILGYVELIREEGQDLPVSKADDDLARVHSAGTHLLSLIDAVLDLTKIEAGQITVTFDEVELDDLIEDAMDSVRPIAQQQGLELRLEAVELGEVVSDRQKLRQILINLLGNALKYTDEGHVTVRARPGDHGVVIAVEDSGVGIDAADLARIFEPFERTTADITRRVGGTGLGLAVSRRLAELTGARLEGRSQPGVGSVFTLTVPRRPAPRRAGSA